MQPGRPFHWAPKSLPNVFSKEYSQVFPLTLNTDDPRFRAGLERMRQFQVARDALAGQRGPIAAIKKLGYLVRSGLTFARLFLLPTQPNTIPDQVRMQPAW